MPHSSGGGHSHHGSHRSSRSKPAEMRFGNKYYRGANRYVYYRNGVPQYYYSDRPYTLQTAKSDKIRKIFSSIFSAFLGLIMAIYGFFSFPHKVKMDYNTEIIINDSARLLTQTDDSEMRDAFMDFQKKTGVTPAFFTINNKDLEKQGGTLYKYSLNLYTSTFDDEKHWLVVYCTHNDKSHWEWEGIIGDDCGSMITEELENQFTEQLQKNLQNDSRKLSDAVINAFETVENQAGKIPVKKLPTLAFALLGGVWLIFIAVRKVVKTSKEKPADDPRINSTECPSAETEPEMAKCEYCGGEFVAGLHTSCPHCGASIETWE